MRGMLEKGAQNTEEYGEASHRFASDAAALGVSITIW